MVFAKADSHYFRTSDNVKLHFIDKGQGQAIVMIPSWTMSAVQYQYQIAVLSQKYRTIALDMRGHGDSEWVDYGYKVYRFAKDVYELLEYLCLDKVILLGHAVGATVIYCYWDLFGSERLDKLILVDKAATTVINSDWSIEEKAQYGAVLDPKSAVDITNQLAGDEGEKYKAIFLHSLFSKTLSAEKQACILTSSMRVPNEESATLFYSNAHQDWRDILPRINIPTLLIVGRASLVSVDSHKWLHQQIKGSQLVIFEKEEGGNHFSFIENPNKFNQIVDTFIQDIVYDE
ncbi:alpha/beta fold hydrolase [Shewanella surugensis]|uniref:Alpha/beta hydrolase n=1 Tax=Shewanella surugensis TaxID=212020 RepID=A0ABT0LDV8_9GAMM|nr:alpha/beta hydrolase [Shewanella surugensis]MCL1125879.1 alpha/beta hydrolase [Shewanella surugensis]